MKEIHWDKKSIAFKLTAFIILIIIAQATLLTLLLIAGGVMSQAKENAYSSFSEKVNSRKDYIQREMKNRWTNMDAYVAEISKNLSYNKDYDMLFKEVSQNLISMLRTTETTGVFIILDDGKKLEEEHSALYIRDYDPLFNDISNRDLYLVYGPAELARENKIPLDSGWSYTMKLNDTNKALYEKPYSKVPLSSNSSLLGYWSTPFRLSPNDIQVITYTMPIFDLDNKFRGIIGVEVSLNYFISFLPASELQMRDSLGYLVGYQGKKEEGISPIITIGAFQNRMIRLKEPFSLKDVGAKVNIQSVQNHNSKENIYACVERIGLYNHNTPFEEEQWYLIGMMTENYLFNYVLKIQRILWMSLSFSLVIGVVGGYIISYHFTKPIVKLAKQVRESDKTKVIKLDATGLAEVDQLSTAMEFANNQLLESTVKMSRIIELVDVPIGAFEYREESEEVFITDQLQLILAIEMDEMKVFTRKKTLFIEKINNILSRPEIGEEDVYIVNDTPWKWVKIKTAISGMSTLGVVIDVTEEVLEKKKIKEDRDCDPLTKIYNRKAVQRQIEEVLYGSEKLGVAAILMFDLDNLKHVNDTYGHKWGDIYIKAAVEQLKTIGEEPNKILGRRSGDEFVLFLYGYPSKEEVKECMQKFYNRLKEEPLYFPDGEVKQVTISSGLMWVESPELSYDELLQYADDALYKAKRFYKGTCCESTECHN